MALRTTLLVIGLVFIIVPLFDTLLRCAAGNDALPHGRCAREKRTGLLFGSASWSVRDWFNERGEPAASPLIMAW